MSKATAAAPPSTANEVPIDRPPRRQSPPTFDCRAATIKPQTTPLRDNHAPSIMPPPRRRIPILIVAAFSSRSPRDTGSAPGSSSRCSVTPRASRPLLTAITRRRKYATDRRYRARCPGRTTSGCAANNVNPGGGLNDAASGPDFETGIGRPRRRPVYIPFGAHVHDRFLASGCNSGQPVKCDAGLDREGPGSVCCRCQPPAGWVGSQPVPASFFSAVLALIGTPLF